MIKILGITAHPDDEAGAFGGTLLLYHSRGVETYVICLTRGQAASNRGEAMSDEELGELRRAEFMASCKILQVTEAQILNYPDSALNKTDFYAVIGDLTRRVRTIKPHLILTMGPEGAITGHPDHSMASIFATMAFHWAAHRDRYPEQLDEGLKHTEHKSSITLRPLSFFRTVHPYHRRHVRQPLISNSFWSAGARPMASSLASSAFTRARFASR